MNSILFNSFNQQKKPNFRQQGSNQISTQRMNKILQLFEISVGDKDERQKNIGNQQQPNFSNFQSTQILFLYILLLPLYLIPKNILQSIKMATFSSTQYGIKATGTATKVPDNPISKLQYYLNTVLGLIEADSDGQLAQIKNYASSSVSSDEFKIILQLCSLLQPDIFLNKCIFVSPQLCGNFNNQFYELSQVTNILGIASGVIIGGQKKNIKKIMACKKEWLLNNYYLPMKKIAQAIQEAQQRQKAQQLLLALSAASSKRQEQCSIM